MSKSRLNTRAIGLDVGAQFAQWLTGAEHLHYGLWTGLDVNAGNLGAAQAAYTDKLFGYLPGESLSILDIGGGAGENARKLIARGHRVDIVTPSAELARRCRVNAPEATTHETRFETFETDARYDLCLFSESLQYIPLDLALTKARALTRPGGHVLIADCFRSDAFQRGGPKRIVGGGHPARAFTEAVAAMPLEQVAGEDITEAVAPSIDVEQGFYKIFGTGIDRFDEELREKRPKTRWLTARLLRLFLSERRRTRLMARLHGDERTSAVFMENNRYLIALLRRVEDADG